MVDWNKLFNEIASEIYRNVKPIIHTRQAEEIVGKGVGGDLTRRVDALAENIAIKILVKNDASCIGRTHGIHPQVHRCRTGP